MRDVGEGSGHAIIDYRCPMCSFELWHPVAELPVSVLGLYDDARFPGRCLLVLKEHHEDLAALAAPLLHRFMDDVVEAARAITTMTQATRINYAVLGNMEPHVHFHLIPRRVEEDPVPTRPPWEHPKDKTQLSEELRRRLVEELRHQLVPGVGDDAGSSAWRTGAP